MWFMGLKVTDVSLYKYELQANKVTAIDVEDPRRVDNKIQQIAREEYVFILFQFA